jgi:NADH:ubiquinone oxidoreductase subunit K
MIESYYFPSIVLFCLAMAGTILKRNIMLSVICTGLMPLAVALLFYNASLLSNKKEGAEVALYLILYAALYMGFGLIYVMNFYNNKKSLMTEDMKITIE